MVLVTVLVFLGVFAVVTPLLIISGKATSRQATRAQAALDSALANDEQKSAEEVINFRKSELFSAIPWINQALQKMDVAPRLRVLLAQANLKWTAGTLLLSSLVCFAAPAYLIDLRTGSLVFAFLVGLAAGVIPFAYVLFMRSKRFGKFEQGLPDALELMVGALRVGHSFSAALGLVTRECADPIGSEFRICFEEQNFGLELRTALENLLTRMPLQDLRIVVTAILIQKESGGNLAEVLEKTAYVIRERFRLKRQIMVHTAQGRLTGWILTLLPIALGIGLYIVNPETMSLLWRRPIGIKLLYAAAGMLVTGSLIIQKIVHMEV
ncbi:MAG: type II secretion system F family protein [Terracidiphilus sp.]|nr:type II secretion system F family protein [Terracidiphilus sp.]